MSAPDRAGIAQDNVEQTGLQSAGGKRFFSDLNPETTFLSSISRNVAVGVGDQRRPDDIGVWVDKREWEALIQQRDTAATGEPIPSQRAASRGEDRLGHRPNPDVLDPLIDIYFKKVHPILPLLEEAEVRRQYARDTIPQPLVHALCLVAAKDAEAEPHLRLGRSAATVAPRQFCTEIHAMIMDALRGPCRYDKVTLIRILALASMHSEGADAAEEASMLLSQAMHHAQTLGIHLGQPSPSGADLSMKRLFWCLYALDRANASMNGRPVIMGDVDIAVEPFAPGESGFPAFEVWLRITDLLNKITAFYRPRVRTDVTGWEDHFPGLEEILDETRGWDLPQSTHRTLHLYYLAVAILSHRSRGIKQIPRGTNSNVRQRLCAGEAIRLMDSYSRDLHALPFVPYAISLALSVAYQSLRQSQFEHQQEDARQSVRQCTRILQSLRRTWSSADTMAALAKKVLSELDRAPSLASFRVPRVSGVDRTEYGNVVGSYSPCMPALNGERTSLVTPLPMTTEGAKTFAGPGPTTTTAEQAGPLPAQDGLDLFDGIDDIFTTYLDPNYPNEDFSFMDGLQPFDWNEADQQDVQL
ncbi:hypothetical protein LTR08_001049 [Meristemomyces frigidus]|nr:hypothetical protein LTR08_001049 [Meristemomyces frigidus]